MISHSDRKNGPERCCKPSQDAVGRRQSPVDICPLGVQAMEVKKLILQYVPEKNLRLVNSGHTWTVNVEGSISGLVGGPLSDCYMLEQFHGHWGESDCVGSEHTVEGRKYAGELHFVHRNIKYKCVTEAAKHPDGLCVLAVFIMPGKENDVLAKVTSKFSCIQHKGESAKIDCPVDLRYLIPNSSCYWTYEGSLTTPPFSECVTWIIFQTPVEVSTEQLAAFRNLKSIKPQESPSPIDPHRGFVKANYRQTLPLGDRVIYECTP